LPVIGLERDFTRLVVDLRDLGVISTFATMPSPVGAAAGASAWATMARLSAPAAQTAATGLAKRFMSIS